MVISHQLHAQTTLPLGKKFQAPAGQEAGPVCAFALGTAAMPSSPQPVTIPSGLLWFTLAGYVTNGAREDRETDSTTGVTFLRTNSDRECNDFLHVGFQVSQP
jgi:hypothetical protein